MATVLIADDDASVRAVMCKALEAQGHTVITAANGDESVQACQRTPADVVIVDIIMPGKDGFDTILELRRINPQQTVIAMSGGGAISGTKYLAVTQILGVQAVLAKPFGPSDLTDLVQRCLSSAN